MVAARSRPRCAVLPARTGAVLHRERGGSRTPTWAQSRRRGEEEELVEAQVRDAQASQSSSVHGDVCCESGRDSSRCRASRSTYGSPGGPSQLHSSRASSLSARLLLPIHAPSCGTAPSHPTSVPWPSARCAPRGVPPAAPSPPRHSAGSPSSRGPGSQLLTRRVGRFASCRPALLRGRRTPQGGAGRRRPRRSSRTRRGWSRKPRSSPAGLPGQRAEAGGQGERPLGSPRAGATGPARAPDRVRRQRLEARPELRAANPVVATP